MQDVAPVVLVHGLFGWGEERPFWGAGPPYFPLNTVRGLWPRGQVVAVDIGVASSDHDRACETFAQLLGLLTDYGEEHAERCGHVRYGPDFRKVGPLLPRWDAAHPAHFVGHSFGGNTSIALLCMLAEDFWGLGTGPEWILSITCICSPLRGCSLVFAIGLDPDADSDGGGSAAAGGDSPSAPSTSAKLVVRPGSMSHMLSIFIGVLTRLQVLCPFWRGFINMRCDQWGTTPISLRSLWEADHPYWRSGDNVAVGSTPAYSRRARDRLSHLTRTRLISVTATPVPPLSPSAALLFATCYGLALGAGTVLVARPVRFVLKLFVRWLSVRRNVPTAAVAAILLTGVSVAAAPSGATVSARWAAFAERYSPWLHFVLGRPMLRMLSYSVLQASASLGSSDKLATHCGLTPNGNDGLIDVASQRWMNPPVYQYGRGQQKADYHHRLWTSAWRRCTRSTEQDLALRAKTLANSFSEVNLHRGDNGNAPTTLEPGRWHVIRVPGGDHALGTSASALSAGMYRMVFELLEAVSRHR